ncbi:PAS domain-containing protein, partial [Proteus mirabilis]|uniref:PAS domain-containing protein n=7 Tax=Pseudomonadati TaxID=3379134 RepID=UPI0013D597A5
MEGRWIAVNNAAMAEFERIFGVQPQIGMRQVDLLEGHVHQDKLREVWARALVEDGYSDIIQYEASDGALHFYEQRFSSLRDAEGRKIGAFSFVYDVSDRLREQERLRQAE